MGHQDLRVTSYFYSFFKKDTSHFKVIFPVRMIPIYPTKLVYVLEIHPKNSATS